ncbi:hypothetical protein [Novipirellula artificiosorum]|uniref:Uncharacterized protein n=1 Tax=Novipirellula artificiosorum TaxID=2528016 RepID=A0A5C6E172_9BACT|nr:hypothetical protein [Novipirellula artificiosorum]TWU42214.1 hypothetical protein Poly41_05100 [Novipirellula artificiosorum]
MAKCDQGYRCEVCGKDVTAIVDSDLYLRFVIGELDPEILHTTAERHIRCNPVLAQFIDHAEFDPLVVDGVMGRANLDKEFVRERTDLVTRGFERLREIAIDERDRDVTTYPLAEVIARYREA